MRWKKFCLLAAVPFLAAAGPAPAQSPRVLYTWKGTGNTQKWVRPFGDNQLLLENRVEGELTVTETGTPGAAAAISDDLNEIAEGGKTVGGLDLTGLESLEFDLGHNGAGPVDVQFYVQATPLFSFRALGPDQPVEPGVATYSAPLADLTSDEIAYIRGIGISIRDHAAEGNLVWTLKEVRSAGEPLTERDFATHEPGTSDGGLQGAIVNFDQAAVKDNDGSQDQSGLSQNVDPPPPGNTGSLHWIDLGGQNGAAVTWQNGTVYNGNTFNERPTDMTNYQKVVVRMAATNVEEGAVATLGVQYFLQTGNFAFNQAGPIQSLPADGEFHLLEFPLTAIPDLDYVDTHGVNLQGHAADLIIDVDYVRAVTVVDFPDCNGNRIPDDRDLADGRSKDCNSNQLPDECDIQSGRSPDCDGNGVPDECDIAGEPRTRVLYTWAGVDNLQSWFKSFGANDVLLENSTDGELTVTESGGTGATWAMSDGFNSVAEGALSSGGLDLTGMSVLEFDLGHSGTGPVAVQFYVQATPGFEYVALGPDQAIGPGINTYTAPLGALNPAQIAYLLAVGMNVRDHGPEGDLVWTLSEVRVTGVGLSQRDFATHDAGASDGGLQGAIVSGDFAAVSGNDGNPNQTGLGQNVGPLPAGNTGSLEWLDLAGQGGGAISWFNGTAWGNSTFNERPTDMSAYHKIQVRMAATNIGGRVGSVSVQYFLQTGGFNLYPAGAPVSLAADGKFHELVFPIADIPDRAYVDAHGLDLGEHPLGDLLMDVDNIRAVSEDPTPRDCNANRIPDSCDLATGVLTDTNQNGIPDSCEGPNFRRGDSNADGQVDLADAVHTLGYLFLLGPSPPCPDSADSNDDGAVDVSDPIFTLFFLYSGGLPIPAPGPLSCGPDPGGDGLTPCGYPTVLCR